MRAIKLMPDYECHPLWGVIPSELGDIDPASLPISTILQQQLRAWADAYDQTLDWEDPRQSGFLTAKDVFAFEAEGERLAEQLRTELGSNYMVLTYIHAYIRTLFT
jgi:hypothetical protein